MIECSSIEIIGSQNAVFDVLILFEVRDAAFPEHVARGRSRPNDGWDSKVRAHKAWKRTLSTFQGVNEISNDQDRRLTLIDSEARDGQFSKPGCSVDTQPLRCQNFIRAETAMITWSS